jgi:uncharacterized protein (DUF1810 family)
MWIVRTMRSGGGYSHSWDILLRGMTVNSLVRQKRKSSMATASATHSTNDPFDLSRFLNAHEANYKHALSEIRGGQKRTHWMWYIFPQMDGLAFSSMSLHYSIKSIEEAQAYLNHPVLGSRLVECAEAVVEVEGLSIAQILGAPDDLKLRSCATLFASVSPSGSVFDRILEKYYHGVRDDKTLHLLENLKEKPAY